MNFVLIVNMILIVVSVLYPLDKMVKKSIKRMRKSNPRNTVARSGIHLYNPGSENFTVHTRVFVEPSAVPNTTLKVGVFTINPITILTSSFSAPLLSMFALFRVNSIKFKVFFSNTSSTTPGIHYSVLTLDTTVAPLPNSNFAEWVYSQPMMKTGRMNAFHVHRWAPIEPSDLNYEPVVSNSSDYGRLYFCADTTTTDVGIYYIEVDLNLNFLNRKTPTALLQSLRQTTNPVPILADGEDWELPEEQQPFSRSSNYGHAASSRGGLTPRRN